MSWRFSRHATARTARVQRNLARVIQAGSTSNPIRRMTLSMGAFVPAPLPPTSAKPCSLAHALA